MRGSEARRDESHADQQKQACLLCNNCVITLQSGRHRAHTGKEGEGPAGDSSHPRGSVTGPVTTGQERRFKYEPNPKGAGHRCSELLS